MRLPSSQVQGWRLCVERLGDGVEVEAGGVLVVEIERERGVVELGADPVGAAKCAGELHFLDGFGGEHFAGLIVLREGLEELFVAEELFEHLRGDLDEVAFGGEA